MTTDITFTERGTGRPIFLLHGGAGPQSVVPFAELLAEQAGVRVITPTHPGFSGTERPDDLDSIPTLALRYVGFLDELDLTDVAVIGNSIGGWIAAELALLHSARVSRLVLVDSMGIEVAGHPPADFFSLTLSEVADYSYFEPDKFRIDPSALPPAAQAVFAGNRAALATYGGTGMADPTLLERLAGIDVPATVIWGEADRIADPDYGRVMASAIPGARFELMAETGHVPQVETPERLATVLTQVLAR